MSWFVWCQFTFYEAVPQQETVQQQEPGFDAERGHLRAVIGFLNLHEAKQRLSCVGEEELLTP